MRRAVRNPSSPIRFSWRFWTLLCGLVTSGCWHTADVELAGCPVVERGPVCVLTEDSDVKLLIRAEPQDRVRILQGGRELPLKAEKRLARDRRAITVTASYQQPALMVTIERRFLWRARREIALRSRQQPAWLTKAHQQMEAGQWEDVRATLAPHLEQAPVRELAWALAYEARIDKAQGMASAARDAYSRAMSAARTAGEVSLELTSMLELSMVLAEQLGHPEEAAALLGDKERTELIRTQQPEIVAWLHLHRAFHGYLLGDWRTALRESKQALDVARNYDARFVALDLHSLRAEIFIAMGRKPEAELELAELNKSLNDEPAPCWNAYTLAAQGRSLVLAREASPGGRDPREPLQKAMHICERSCQLFPLAAAIASDFARTEVLDQRYAEASRWLDLAARLLPAPQGIQSLERSELLGELALGRAVVQELHGNSEAGRALRQQALQHFEQMRQRAQGPDVNEHTFRALLGLARVEEGLDPEHALWAYREAEKYLDIRSLDMPLGAGQGSFLWKNGRATRYLVELLVRRELPEEAFRVIRRARRRALQVASARLRAPLLKGANQELWQQALQEYRQKRAELDQRLRKADESPLDEREELRKDPVAQSEEALREILEKALRAVAGAVGSQSDPAREPGAGEALLACHPGRSSVICLLRTPSGIAQTRLSSLDKDTGLDALSVGLLQPFTEQLRQTRRLYVLPGVLHNLDLHRAPFLGRPLEEQLEVRYSLDLPPENAATGEVPRRALLLFDLDDEADIKTASAESVEQGLGRDGWAVRRLPSSSEVRGTWDGRSPAPDGNKRMLLFDELQKPLGLLMIYGRSDINSQASGWGNIQLHTADRIGLRISDILSLPAPSGAIVLSCSSGFTSEDAPGPEGLPLAQAYLMAGARFAIGTTRQIDPELAAQVAGALSNSGAEAVLADPARALQRALNQVRQRHGAANKDLRSQLAQTRAEEELNTYRVFFP